MLGSGGFGAINDAGAVADINLAVFMAMNAALAGADARRRTSLLRSIVRLLSSSNSYVSSSVVERTRASFQERMGIAIKGPGLLQGVIVQELSWYLCRLMSCVTAGT